MPSARWMRTMLKDKRSGKIAIVAHCILNQNSRVFGLAKRSSAIAEIVKFLTLNDMGIIQMPCPELTYAGVLRQSQTKNQYDNAKFRSHCKKIAEETVAQIQEYSKGKIKAKIIIGVDGSPSCGIADSGILIEELKFTLKEKGLTVPFYGIRYERLSKDLTKLRKLIRD
jgi:predicted secreted protein